MLNQDRKSKTDEFESKTQRLPLSQNIITTLKKSQLEKPISYELFIENLKFAKLNRPKELLKLISASDLEDIYNYFLREDNPITKKIKALGPTESLRLDKHITGLARTLNILRTKENEFILILETKSKLADGTKQILPKPRGATKTGKPAWRLDGDVKTYFNLVAIIESKADNIEIKKEEVIAKHFNSPYLDTKELGEIYSKKGKTKRSVYSEKAISDLSDFIEKNPAFKTFTLKQKYDLLLDLFRGVEDLHLHNEGLVHQDLKPENILVYGNDKTGYHLKITDFGKAIPENSERFAKDNAFAWACATVGYESPEIRFSFEKPYNGSVQDYNQCRNYYMKYTSYALQCTKNQSNPTPNFIEPHPANDMWALGIIAYVILYNDYEILYNDHPKVLNQNIEKNILIKGLLEPNRKDRLTIKGARALLEALRIQAEQDERAKRIAKELTLCEKMRQETMTRMQECIKLQQAAEAKVKEAEIKAKNAYEEKNKLELRLVQLQSELDDPQKRHPKALEESKEQVSQLETNYRELQVGLEAEVEAKEGLRKKLSKANIALKKNKKQMKQLESKYKELLEAKSKEVEAKELCQKLIEAEKTNAQKALEETREQMNQLETKHNQKLQDLKQEFLEAKNKNELALNEALQKAQEEKTQADERVKTNEAKRIRAEAAHFAAGVIASSTAVALIGGAQTIGGLLFEAGTASALPTAGLVGISLATGFALALTATGLVYSVNAFYNWYTKPIDKHKPHANESTSPLHDNSNVNLSPGQNFQHFSMLSKLLTFSWSTQRPTVLANDTQRDVGLPQDNIKLSLTNHG